MKSLGGLSQVYLDTSAYVLFFNGIFGGSGGEIAVHEWGHEFTNGTTNTQMAHREGPAVTVRALSTVGVAC